MSLMVSCCAVFFQRDVLDEIFDLVESVPEGFLPTLGIIRDEFPFWGFYRCVNAGKSVTH